MSNATIHQHLKIAEYLAHATHKLLLTAVSLTESARHPPSYRAAVNKACGAASELWLQVGNVAPLFDEPAEPGDQP